MKNKDGELLNRLLEAALSAPYASKIRPWNLRVINGCQFPAEITKWHLNSKLLRETSVVILVCGDGKMIKSERFWLRDCAVATEKLLITVLAKGLKAGWLGLYPMEERVVAVQKFWGIQEDVIPFSIIPIVHSQWQAL